MRKGEKGIAIFVPFRRNRAKKADPDAEETVIGFGIGHVFDLAQTDGAPLPRMDVPVLDGDAGGELYTRLAALAAAERITVTEKPAAEMSDSVMGLYEPAPRALTVRVASPLQMVKTLAHELAHHFTGRHETYDDARAEHETIAESVAYVVLAYFGLDSGARSFPYVATWSTNGDAFRAALAEIQRVSARMIDALVAAGGAKRAKRIESSAPVAA